jgi:hypothetical protein
MNDTDFCTLTITLSDKNVFPKSSTYYMQIEILKEANSSF